MYNKKFLISFVDFRPFLLFSLDKRNNSTSDQQSEIVLKASSLHAQTVLELRGGEGPAPQCNCRPPPNRWKNRRQGGGLRQPNRPATQWNQSHKSRGGTTLKNLARHAPYSGIWGPGGLSPAASINFTSQYVVLWLFLIWSVFFLFFHW